MTPQSRWRDPSMDDAAYVMDASRYVFALEPQALVDAFRNHPPLGFAAWSWRDGTPLFHTHFDLLTTADTALAQRVRSLPGYRRWGGLLRWRTLFAGATVSEYLPLSAPAGVSSLPIRLRDQYGCDYPLLILKDIPQQSPLLSARDNRLAASLAHEAQQAGYVLLQGQALAYVPIDFRSIEEWLVRFSGKRRYDIRRKLKQRALLAVETWPLGSTPLQDAVCRAELYALYQQVYAQSEVHFDELSPGFFDAIFTDPAPPGFVFVFRHQGRIIGWKLCFEHAGMLIDKYVGFDYPEARRFGLFFVSFAECLGYALRHGLKYYVIGWTDPEVKAYLGAQFTLTQHAVWMRNPLLRMSLRRLAHWFEADARKLIANGGPPGFTRQSGMRQ